jgi:hypothetical protein
MAAESRWDIGLWDTALWDTAPATGAIALRRMERTTAAGLQRQEIKHLERTAPAVMRRVDE